MWQVSVHANSLTDLKEQLLGLARMLSAETTEPTVIEEVTREVPTPPETVGTADAPEVPKSDDKKPAEKPVSEMEVRKALNALMQAKGRDAVRAILTAHNATSFPTLSADEYAAVIKEATDATR